MAALINVLIITLNTIVFVMTLQFVQCFQLVILLLLVRSRLVINDEKSIFYRL